MAVTVIDLCNMALGKVGGGRIVALTDSSAEAVWCNALYEQTRDEVLQEHEWSCATEMQELAELEDAPLFGYQHQFALPTDPKCLRILSVEPQGAYERLGDTIQTDNESVSLKYIKRVEDPGEMDPLLIEAIACKLAAKLAIPLANKRDLQRDLLGEYLLAVRKAKGVEALEQEPEEEPDYWTDR